MHLASPVDAQTLLNLAQNSSVLSLNDKNELSILSLEKIASGES